MKQEQLFGGDGAWERATRYVRGTDLVVLAISELTEEEKASLGVDASEMYHGVRIEWAAVRRPNPGMTRLVLRDPSKVSTKAEQLVGLFQSSGEQVDPRDVEVVLVRIASDVQWLQGIEHLTTVLRTVRAHFVEESAFSSSSVTPGARRNELELCKLRVHDLEKKCEQLERLKSNWQSESLSHRARLAELEK